MLSQLFLVAGIHLLAVMSPGPDFAMVMRNSLVYSRRTGVLAALGLSLGIALHVTYSLLGIGLLISRSILLFNAIKWIGALYLIFIGVRSLIARQPKDDKQLLSVEKQDLTTNQALRMGFLTNALNPKATLFFLALFTTVVSPSTPVAYKLVYGLEMVIATFAWFAFVAVILSHSKINSLFARVKHRIEKVFGVVLIAFGLKVALGSHK
ncbi:MAG TPA: LysE family transporter [Candidatus Saccharibacteria bacterium]|nr:LysE family transporter [Candidatus Saccharibacteria bacterium]